MENNNPIPAVNQPIVQQTKSGNGAVWIVIVVVLIVLVVAVGAYWYMNNKLSNKGQGQNQASVSQSTENLTQDLNSIPQGNVDSDLSDIDKDIQSL